MISVVIPTLNEEGYLGATLASIRRQAGPYEIIVVDGGSTDRTASIAAREAKILEAPPGRANQMNRGAKEAKGEILLFLHADTLLPAEAFEAIRLKLTHPRIVCGVFSKKFDSNHPLLLCLHVITRLNLWFQYGDQAIFVRQTAFERVAGYRLMPIMEDLDLLRRLRKIGKGVVIRKAVTTSARRFVRNGVIRQVLLDLTLLLLYLLGANPRSLKRWYGEVR